MHTHCHYKKIVVYNLGGEAAAAGVKVGDEILEVNGHRCKTMQLLELMQLKSLLQHVAASIGKDGELNNS